MTKKMDNLLQLCYQIQLNSGFQRESKSTETIEWMKGEVGELEQAILSEDRGAIIDEVGDMLTQSILLYNKVLIENGITDFEVYNRQVSKYNHRAPHILQGKYLTKAEEMKQWTKNKQPHEQ